MYSFFQINPTAGMLLVPYQIWLTLATCLNYSIAMNNEDEPEKAEWPLGLTKKQNIPTDGSVEASKYICQISCKNFDVK